MKNALDKAYEQLAYLEPKRDFPLKEMTTFGAGGAADLFVTAASSDDVLRVLQLCQSLALPVFCLGGGSNLLISDEGIRGVVLFLGGELAQIKADEQAFSLQVGAGASFPVLTKKALSMGFETALGWFGVPGQVGGALKMNAGTRHGEIGDVVLFVEGVSGQGKHLFLNAALPKERIESFIVPAYEKHEKHIVNFSYRQTDFPAQVILTTAFLHCDKPNLEAMDSLRAQAKTLYIYRQKSQPKAKSAGSMFKNPPGDYAGRLIEACGLKGRRVGGALISPLHANFLVNDGNACAQDIYTLAILAQREVWQKFHIKLDFEVKLVGSFLEC